MRVQAHRRVATGWRFAARSNDSDAIVNWIIVMAGHVDVRWENVPDGSLTEIVAVTLPVTDPTSDFAAVTIEGPHQRVVGVMRDLEDAYAQTDPTRRMEVAT